MKAPNIILKNVRVHNLKNVSLRLKPKELIVFTGVSGSGKSSLAFDTIYAEGQRRYLESLSHQVRRSLGDIPKPDAEDISGIAPTIAIEQKTAGKTPRSTVGTMTGIYDFLRVLFAKISIPHCPISKEPVIAQSKEKIIAEVQSLPKQEKLIFLAPFAKGQKGEFIQNFQELVSKGFTRARVDGAILDLTENIQLDKKVAHDIDIVIDRTTTSDPSRCAEAVGNALEFGNGLFSIYNVDQDKEITFSQFAYAKKSNISYGPLAPHDFSFNHPEGMCPTCHGLGTSSEFNLSQIINPDLSIQEDCCAVASSYHTVRYGNIYDNLARIYRFNIKTPWAKLPKEAQEAFLYGIPQKWTKMSFIHPEKKTHWVEYVQWKGVIHEAKERLIQAKSDLYRKKMTALMHEDVCPSCQGSRIKPYPSEAKIGDKKIHEITRLSLEDCFSFFKNLTLPPIEKQIAEELLKEIQEKLSFLINVGLDYLSLDRTAPTLSGGESQRVRLAAQIGAGLVGAIYVLDEPSIGLHPSDHHRLVETLLHLRNLGNTVIVVEHDIDTILAADTIVDVGPGAGKHGGEILSIGSVETIIQNPKSITGKYLSQEIKVSKKRRKVSKEKITIQGASHHNLQRIDVEIPLNGLICVTGVSGSGKSSLITETLYPALANHLHGAELNVGKHKAIQGFENIDKVISVDQSPIGRTPRSNAATYIKLLDDIRNLFENLQMSKLRGFNASHFSFNVKEGSCSYCEGLGQVRIDMDFMEDAWVECPQCKGKRFDPEILQVRYKNKNIADILETDVEHALILFEAIPSIRKKLEVLSKVGLDYLQLGQPSTTLSGGEAQRIKLARELSRPQTGKTLYILDEPTTGLHFHDIQRLINVLDSLVEKGNTVLVIEHNLDFIRSSDWIIDLGPGAGIRGGKLVAKGTPETIIKYDSPTAKVLREPFQPLTQKKTKIEKPSEEIIIENATQNNLKSISVNIPKGSITVFTGPSGSGKSSLAFDTLYAEGQRRYTETLSSYARTLVKPLAKPKVDRIDGLSPAIALEQKTGGLNPRSTIGTVTESYDLLRILYAHLGTAFDPETKEEIKQISKEYVVQKALSLPLQEKIQILSPISLSKKQTFEELISDLNKEGYLRIRLNNSYFEIDAPIPFEKKSKNEIYLVVDRMSVDPKNEKRLFEAIQKATERSNGIVVIAKEKEDLYFNLDFAVESTGKSYPRITPQTFSFNHDSGMCLECQGLGLTYGAHLLEHPEILKLSLLEIADRLFKEKGSDTAYFLLEAYFTKCNIDCETPLKKLSEKDLHFIFNGGPSIDVLFKKQKKVLSLQWQGLNPFFAKASKMARSEIKESILPLLKASTCLSCEGSRLNPLARNVRIENVSLPELCDLSIQDAYLFVQKITLDSGHFLQESLSKIQKSLEFLQSIGLGYLSLNRSAPTLSGGELQRVRLARQLGSGLTSCLYILDEPTIGLHPFNNERLNKALQKLRDLNNTIILVEHDPMTIQIADFLLDFGPKAGKEGGQITAQGPLSSILKDPNSLTGAYLSQRKKIPIPQKRRPLAKGIEIKNANLHNLKNISLTIPYSAITCFTGVSGSGKSTLVRYLLKPAAEAAVRENKKEISLFGTTITGLSAFEKVITIDQSPIGQTIRADVSTYTDIQPLIRSHLAELPQAKIKGLMPGHFSPNHKKGMCRTCWGLGYKMIDLQFLPSVKITCESCKGYRLNTLSLEIKYKGKNFGEILHLTIQETLSFFEPIPKIAKRLRILESVGLSYLQLGQELHTLSGGEAQRLRLSRELAKRESGKTLYLIDEPTVGLHSEDIAKLLPIFHQLADKKNTLVIIEHNIDVILNADYIIDLGPDAGIFGGEIIAQGTPEEIAMSKTSKTAKYLKQS